MRLSASATFQNVKSIKAHVLGTSGAPLIIELGTGNWRAGVGEISIYTGDHILDDRLVRAINHIVANRKAELADAAKTQAA